MAFSTSSFAARCAGNSAARTAEVAWAATANDEAAFGARLTARLTLLGTMEGSPVGFAALEGPAADKQAADNQGPDKQARIDMLYVHPAAAGLGVGSMLIDALEKLAAARGVARLIADVSDSAQEFFKRRGFVPRQRNTVTLGDEWLASTTMDKQLAAKERAS